MADILDADTFVCHKKTYMQCAGNMLINEEQNSFVQLATQLRIELNLAGAEQVFASREACIEHHKN